MPPTNSNPSKPATQDESKAADVSTFEADLRKALDLKDGASQSDILAEVRDLVSSFDAGTSKPTGNDSPKVLAVISMTGQERSRGTYVIPHDKALVLDESKMDPIDIQSINEDNRLLKVRTTDAFTPESEITRFKRA